MSKRPPYRKMKPKPTDLKEIVKEVTLTKEILRVCGEKVLV